MVQDWIQDQKNQGMLLSCGSQPKFYMDCLDMHMFNSVKTKQPHLSYSSYGCMFQIVPAYHPVCSGVGNCPILGILDITLKVAI